MHAGKRFGEIRIEQLPIRFRSDAFGNPGAPAQVAEQNGYLPVLTIDATDPKSGTAEFKAAAVRIEKLTPAAACCRSAS